MSFAAHLPFPPAPSALSQSQPSQVSSSPPTPTTNRGCCENGRPVLTDPATGQSVCSCQYSSALLGYSRLPGLSGSLFSPSSYSAGAPPPSGYGVALGSEGSAFYAPLTAGGNNLRDTTDAWRSLTQTSLYETSPMGFYPYGGYGGLDLNARRKNATRESTNTLKAWLHEHIKNPYPTKGEKIMLAIITKMTLTQVSTWFANARRRLKKENKMTWSPRNRSEDGDEDDDDDDGGDEKAGDEADKEKRLSNDSDELDVDGSGKSQRPKTHNHSSSSNNNNNTAESDSVSPAPSIGEDSRSRLSPPQSRDSDPSFHLGGHTPATDLEVDKQKPKIWSVTDFLHPKSNSELSSCKETGMKMDVMRCVPTSAEAAATSAVDLTGSRTVGSVSASAAAAHAHAQAHAAALSARGAGFLPPMTTLSPAQQLSSYQNALASYAAHSSPYSPYALASAEMNKLVMKPTATRFNPYGVSPKQSSLESPFPPARDFSVLREGE